MNFPASTKIGEVVGKAGAVGSWGAAVAAPAQLSTEDAMAASILRLTLENDELRAEVAVLREEQRILNNTIESLRDALCSYKCRDKAAADGGWANI